VISNWETSGDTLYANLKYTMKSNLGVTSYNWGYIFLANSGSQSETYTIDDIQGMIRVYKLYVSKNTLNYNDQFTARLTIQNIGTSGISPFNVTANIIIRYKPGYYVDQWLFAFDYMPPASEANATFTGNFGKNSAHPLPERQYPLMVKFTCYSAQVSFTTREHDLPILISSDSVYVRQYLNVYEDPMITRTFEWYSINATSNSKFYLALVDENLLVPVPQFKTNCDLPLVSDISLALTVGPSTCESTIQVNATITVSNNQAKPIYVYITLSTEGVFQQWNLTKVSSTLVLNYSWYAPAADLYSATSKSVTANVLARTSAILKTASTSYTIYNKPPTIVLVSPDQNEPIEGNLTIDLSIYDESGVKTAMYRWNQEPQWMFLSSPYDIFIDTNRFENGRNFLNVRAVDNAGNPAETTFYLIVQNAVPEATWVAAVRAAIALFAQLGFFPILLLAFLCVIAGVYIGYMRAKAPQPQAVVVRQRTATGTRPPQVVTTRYEFALPKGRQELFERVKRERRRGVL